MYNQPSQMFLHPDGDSLVVLDVGNYAVRRVFLLDGSATTIAGTPQSAGYSDGGVGAGKLGTISDMIPGVDGETVYLSDNTVFAVRSFNLTTGYITTICGGGIQIMNGDCSSSAMIGIIRGMAMDPSGDGRFLYMLTQSEDPTTFQMGTYLQYIDMNFMYTGTLDSQIQGGGNFWLRFIGGQLSTWAQDPGGGNVNGRVVALTIDSGQGMNQDLNALSTLMEYPGPFNGSTLPQIWMPPCLSPDMQYYTTMAGSPYAEPFNAPPMVWRNHLPCDESSIVPGVSVMQSCTPHFSTRPCRREEPLFPSATPPPVVGINDTWVDNDPIYHLPSNEVWRSTTISRSDHQYYNLAWFCDSRAGPDINTTAALEATALGSTGLGPIHTIHTSVNGSLVFGQREGLWELDLESNSATVYHALRSPELVGYPLLTRRFDEAGAVVAGTLVLDMETEDIIAGSTTPGYEVGIGGQARFSRITNAHYVGSFPQDPGGPFLVLEDRSIATGTYWRPMDPVEGRVGGALLSFEGYMITMTSFLVDPEDGTMVYACTGSRLLLLRIRDPEVWDLLVPQQGGFEAGDRLLVGLPLGAPSPSVVDYPLNGMPGPGYPMSGVEELSMSPCHRFIYMVSFSRGRRDVLRYHIPSGNVMWIPDFPNVPVSDLAFRGMAIAGSGASHRHIGIVSGSCGLTIVERGCDVGMGFTGSHPYAGEVVCTDCLDWEYSAYMDHDCRNLTLECPEGTLADGNNTRGSTVTCVPCPWGFACPQRHVSINYYWFPQPWMLSWITSCGPGTYGYGDNNSTHTASCQPCPAGYACTGTSSLDGNETSFVPVWNQSGVVPWTMECGEGTYPTGSNGPTTTATCVPCPPLSRCPPTSADELGVFPHPPTIIPWVLSCPPGTLPVGSEGSAYCSPCGVPHVAPYSCPDAHNATPNANGTLAPFLDVTPPIPWVLWCDGGSLFRGSNTNLTSAWCAPCPERTACFAGNDTGYDGDPWVESCGVGSYAEGVNTNSSIVSCVGCPPVGAGCPGGAVEDALLYAWVGSCPPGTSYESGWNTLDHLNPVVCGVCPWNMSCPEATPVDNTTANQTGRGENTTTYMVPWVWVCPPGTYGVGSNTELVSARCASPCTPQRACLGTEARVVDGDAEDGDGYEVSFIWDGRSPWNLQCPPGSYPSSNNTDRSLAECSPCPDGYACPEWSYADPITGLFHNRSTLIIRHLTDCPQEGQVVVGTSNTSVGQCVVPTPAPTPAPTPVPTPAPTPAPTSLGDRSFVLQVGLGGGVDAPTIRSLVMAESLPRGPYASRYDVGISKMLGGYPTSISTLAYDSGAFLSVTSFVTVRIEDAAAMLELGASRISSSSVASQMALEVGTIGITADVVEPPPDVAVGRWFVEVLGEGGYHAMSGARGRGCASPLLTLIALACIGWTLYH